MVSNALSEIQWAPTDALNEGEKFKNRWVEPDRIKQCVMADCWLISGEKGSGKSAIRVAVRNQYIKNRDIVREIDFKDISFSATAQNIADIARTTNLESMTLLSNAWQYIIMSQAISACAESFPKSYGEYLHSLKIEGYNKEEAAHGFFNIIENMWNKIDNFTRSNSSANILLSGSVSAKILSDIRIFPLSMEFRKLRSLFFSTLEKLNHNVVVIIDGLDQISKRNVDVDDLNTIFEGLADAALRIKGYESLPDGFNLKIIIPHDRYMRMENGDLDKISPMHESIWWDREALEDFVKKRIQASSGAIGGTFESLWNRYLPSTVKNTRNGNDEDTFAYIVRHSMNRPRDIQDHLIGLSKKYYGRKIEPAMVSKSVSETSRVAAENWYREYKLDFPSLRDFVSAFYKGPNIFTAREMRERVRSFLRKNRQASSEYDVNLAVESLYQMGLFGVVNKIEHGDERRGDYYPPCRTGERYRFDFYFKDHANLVASRILDDEEVALHPIFNEELKLRTDLDRIVG